MIIRRVAALLLVLTACNNDGAAPAECAPCPTCVGGALEPIPECDPDAPAPTDVLFELSPGGIVEVDTRWVAEHGCKVRIVDVREPTETREGVIEGAEVVPLDDVLDAAREWNPHEPVIFVCRSGRRSGRAVGLVERLGFSQAASLTGGVLAWQSAGLELVPGPPVPPEALPPVHEPNLEGPVTADELQASLSRVAIDHVRAAGLLLQSSASCVDGRDEAAVMGTPGGDAGELLLALATIEELTGEELDLERITTVFEHYVDAFGRLYFHTDDHAREHLVEHLRHDADFAGIEDFDAMLRHPPMRLRPKISEAYIDPNNVGCGHLKLVLLHSEEYGVRLELAELFLQVLHRERWASPELVDYVVLHGSHEEDAILTVHHHGDADVHAFTNVPAIPPHVGGRTFFIHHPLVARFLRAQHADFLMNELDMLRAHGVDAEHFELALERNAQTQLGLTVGYLAPTLPVFDIRIDDDDTVHVQGAHE